jgi:hypothetical protein
MPFVHLWMRCSNDRCKHPIEIQPPTKDTAHSFRGGWPKADWHPVFLCLGCGQAHEYSSRHVQMNPAPTRSPWDNRKYQCWSLTFECCEGNCGTPTRAYIVADGSTAKEGILIKFPVWSLHSRCRTGDHPLRLPATPDQVRLEPCQFPFRITTYDPKAN